MFKDQKTIYYIGIFVIFLLLYKLIDNLGTVFESFLWFMKLLTPVFMAFMIAYLLRPLVNLIESKFKVKRLLSILVVYTLFIGFVVLSITFIAPKMIDSVTKLLASLPRYTHEMNLWITDLVVQSEWMKEYGITEHAKEYLTSASDNISEFINSLLNNLVSIIFSLTSTLLNLVIGMIISIYMLIDKEKLGANSARLVQAIFPRKKADQIIQFTKQVDTLFSKYFAGIIFDSLIIGVMALIGFLILKTPFALLSSIATGITNVIPYFGPLVGIVFVMIITAIVSPIKALWAGLFLFILQQFDGYYLKPKILGDKVGISPLWIILAIIIGGGTFGVFGMFVAVPIFAVIKTTIDTFVNRRLKEKYES